MTLARILNNSLIILIFKAGGFSIFLVNNFSYWPYSEWKNILDCIFPGVKMEFNFVRQPIEEPCTIDIFHLLVHRRLQFTNPISFRLQ